MPYKDPEKQKQAQAKYYRENHAKIRAQANKYSEIRKSKAVRWVNQYKVDHPTCTDCQLDYPPHILDFDHLRDKIAGVAQLQRNGNIAAIKAEIEKCEIVCANCHRHRTWLRSVKVT
jgi:hypothetical protein